MNSLNLAFGVSIMVCHRISSDTLAFLASTTLTNLLFALDTHRRPGSRRYSSQAKLHASPGHCSPESLTMAAFLHDDTAFYHELFLQGRPRLARISLPTLRASSKKKANQTFGRCLFWLEGIVLELLYPTKRGAQLLGK